MNHSRNIKKIIKKKMKKYVSPLMKKSAKVMQRTVFDFNLKNLISGQLYIVSSIFICLYLIYLKYTFS